MRRRIASLLYTAASQVSQSATSFLVTLSFARLLTPADFGFLAGVWLIWMLILSFNRSVFAEQLLSQGLADKRSSGYGAFFVLWIGVLTIFTTVFLVAVQMSQLLPGAIYIAAFVGSDAIRYWFFARDHTIQSERRQLVAVETARLILAVVFMTVSVLSPREIAVMWISVVIGLIWPIVGFWTIRRISISGATQFLRMKSKFEVHIALQYFVATGVAQLLPLLALPVYGSSSFGGMRLTQSSLSPLALLGTSFQPGMIKILAEGKDHRTLSRNLAVGVTICTVVGFAMGAVAYWVVLTTGRYWLPSDQLPLVQQLSLPVIVALTFVLIGQPGGAVIRVLRLGGLSLLGQIVGIAASVVALYFVIRSNGGLYDFVWAVSVGTIGTVCSTYALLARHLGRSGLGRHADG